MTPAARARPEYFVLMDPDAPTEIDALLRKLPTPRGPINQAFTWRCTWGPTVIFAEVEHGSEYGRLIPITAKQAARVRRRFVLENLLHLGRQR